MTRKIRSKSELRYLKRKALKVRTALPLGRRSRSSSCSRPEVLYTLTSARRNTMAMSSCSPARAPGGRSAPAAAMTVMVRNEDRIRVHAPVFNCTSSNRSTSTELVAACRICPRFRPISFEEKLQGERLNRIFNRDWRTLPLWAPSMILASLPREELPRGVQLCPAAE